MIPANAAANAAAAGARSGQHHAADHEEQHGGEYSGDRYRNDPGGDDLQQCRTFDQLVSIYSL